MSKCITVMVIVEGMTEVTFIKEILSIYLGKKGIYMIPTQIKNSGQRGGNVRFSSVMKNINAHIRNRKDTYISLFFDYYGLKSDWPGLSDAQKETEPMQIASIINNATHEAVNKELSEWRSNIRFIPHLAVHEFESLLFSNATKLAKGLNVTPAKIEAVLNTFGDPEKINNSRATAPSKRLNCLHCGYKKTITGIEIAEDIGIEAMRRQCKVFNAWISALEQTQKVASEQRRKK